MWVGVNFGFQRCRESLCVGHRTPSNRSLQRIASGLPARHGTGGGDGVRVPPGVVTMVVVAIVVVLVMVIVVVMMVVLATATVPKPLQGHKGVGESHRSFSSARRSATGRASPSAATCRARSSIIRGSGGGESRVAKPDAGGGVKNSDDIQGHGLNCATSKNRIKSGDRNCNPEKGLQNPRTPLVGGPLPTRVNRNHDF